MPPKNNSCLKTASIGKRTTSTVSNNKKNSTTEPLAVNDNLPTTRKRGRSQATKAVDETVIVEEEEKKGIKATDTVNKEGIVNDLNVSSSSTTAAGTDKPDNEEEQVSLSIFIIFISKKKHLL